MALITLDFESFYSKDFSLSKMTTESYIRDLRFQVIGFGYRIDAGEPVWVTGTDKEIADALHALDLPNNKILAHNCLFDSAILSFRYGIHPKFMYDTLSMARPIQAITKGGSLASLAQKFMLGEKGTEIINALGKRREDFTPDEMARYGEYCKNDVVLTYNLFHVLQQYSTPQECFIIDLMLRMYTDPIIELDSPLLVGHLSRVQARKEELMSKLDASIGRDALMSNPKFAEVLQAHGVEPPTKVSLTTNKLTFAFSKTDVGFKALLEHENPDVQALVAARLGVKSTLEETRTESFIQLSYRGTLPIMLNYYGAHTGRASGGDGMNLQNLPRGGALRNALKAPKGHKFVVSDSSQIEARMVGWLAGQDDLTEAFANGEDVYSLFATDIYGRPVSKADKIERFVGKTGILGLGYGCGAAKFKTMLKTAATPVDVELSESERIVSIYRARYPMIPKLWKQGEEAIKAMAHGNVYYLGTGIILTCDGEGVHLPNGMIQRYPNLRYLKADGEKIKKDGWYYDTRYGPTGIYGAKLIENVVQALARIVVFTQMAKIEQQLRKFDKKFGAHVRFKTVLTVHDECCVICPAQSAEKVQAMMESEMSKAPKWAEGLPVSCEADNGFTYGDTK
jgi:DNA polymerase I-like protein with 3'-5' exonuclease and polymerase domains